jgi:hypothetical protein
MGMREMSESAVTKRIAVKKGRRERVSQRGRETPRPRGKKDPNGTHRSYGTALYCTADITGHLILTYLSLKKPKATQVIRDGQRNRFIEIRSCSDDGYSNNLHGLRCSALFLVSIRYLVLLLLAKSEVIVYRQQSFAGEPIVIVLSVETQIFRTKKGIERKQATSVFIAATSNV